MRNVGSDLDAIARFKYLTFLPIEFNLERFREQIRDQILLLDSALGFWSSYQNCRMLPVWTSGGLEQEMELARKDLAYQWTSIAARVPALQRFLESEVFALIEGNFRVVVLVTPPRSRIKVHVDCAQNSVDQLQHKLRFAVSGSPDGLWFLDSRLHKRHIGSQHRSYILDGSHPHGADNDSDQPKITICLGSPWNGQLYGSFLEKMKASHQKFSGDTIFREELGRPLRPEFYIESLKASSMSGMKDPRDDISIFEE